jgi:hypothetical protein
MDELFQFLTHPDSNVRHLAIQHISGFTNTLDFTPDHIKAIMPLIQDDPTTIAHDALKTLINLSSKPNYCAVMNHSEFLKQLILLIILPKNITADLCCMLLNNLSKHESFLLDTLLPKQDDITTSLLDNLIEIFLRGEGKRFNQNADFHFISGVLSNLTMFTPGARFMLGKSKVDDQYRLLKVICFLGHENLYRRGGCASVIKNCCFDTSVHMWLLTDPELNLLPYLLLPLMGPEDYDEEDMNDMPEELQLLPNDKKREPDAKIRLILVETLLLLCSSPSTRDVLRMKKVYPILQKMHLVEQDEQVQETIERVVQMLMRDEAKKRDVGIEDVEE